MDDGPTGCPFIINGYLDGVTKKIFDGEEIFHLAYYSKIKRVLKRLEGKIIDDKLTNK